MITYQQVKDELLKLAAEHPRRTNATDHPVYSGISCVYTDKYRHRHCIAGTVAKNLGLRVPSYNDPDNRATRVDHVHEWRNGIDHRGLRLLKQAQLEADALDDRKPTRWGVAVVRALREDGDYDE